MRVYMLFHLLASLSLNLGLRPAKDTKALMFQGTILSPCTKVNGENLAPPRIPHEIAICKV